MNKDQLLAKLTKATEDLKVAKDSMQYITVERDAFFSQAREAGATSARLREALEDVTFVPKGMWSGKKMRVIAEEALK